MTLPPDDYKKKEPFTKPKKVPNQVATCVYCAKEKKYSKDLPFLKWNKNVKKWFYYCGCFGWD